MPRRTKRKTIALGEGIPVTLTGIAYGGEAVGRHDGAVVFVAGGIPGEEVSVDLFQDGKLLRGVIRQVRLPSPWRTPAPCPYFGYCGGCQWQHIVYSEQLELKARIVREQLQRIGGFVEPPVRPAVGSPHQWNYRNHVRFSVGRHGHLGFMRPASHRFLAIDRCLISHEAINELLVDVQGQGRGLHQVVMRVGEHTGDCLIYPVLNTPRHPHISNDRLTELLLGRRFQISLSSFFQVNSLQAEQLARIVIDRLALTGKETVVDAYGGVGTFAVLMADQAAQVVSVEESSSAIRDAQVNAAGMVNVRFIAGKTESALPQLAEASDAVHAVVLDPARVGCSTEVIDALGRLRPPRIVYVSCDLGTLARDLRLLHELRYRLLEVQPVDMFPQTYHIENVATLALPSV